MPWKLYAPLHSAVRKRSTLILSETSTAHVEVGGIKIPFANGPPGALILPGHGLSPRRALRQLERFRDDNSCGR